MDTPELPDREEQDIATLLQAAGRREQLPPALKQRWEAQFRNELRPVLERRQRRRRGLVAGLGACAALLLAVIMFDGSSPTAKVPGIRIAAVSGVVRASDESGKVLELTPGHRLPTAVRIQTGPDGFLGMTQDGYQLRLNARAQLKLAEGELYLAAGALYVSDDPVAGGDYQLIIATPQGTVRDIGTQFIVEVQPERTITTVRRGAVILDTGTMEHLANAKPGRASRLTATRDEPVKIESVAPVGEAWQWIYRDEAAFELEGSSAYEFLRWSVGESGLQLEFASKSAEIHARTAIMHGDIGGLNPEQAVAPVLATTDLSATVTEDFILRVALRQRD